MTPAWKELAERLHILEDILWLIPQSQKLTRQTSASFLLCVCVFLLVDKPIMMKLSFILFVICGIKHLLWREYPWLWTKRVFYNPYRCRPLDCDLTRLQGFLGLVRNENLANLVRDWSGWDQCIGRYCHNHCYYNEILLHPGFLTKKRSSFQSEISRYLVIMCLKSVLNHYIKLMENP